MRSENTKVSDRFHDSVASIDLRKETLKPFRVNAGQIIFGVETQSRFRDRYFAEIGGENLNRYTHSQISQNFHQNNRHGVRFFAG